MFVTQMAFILFSFFIVLNEQDIIVIWEIENKHLITRKSCAVVGFSVDAVAGRVDGIGARDGLSSVQITI